MNHPDPGPRGAGAFPHRPKRAPQPCPPRRPRHRYRPAAAACLAAASHPALAGGAGHVLAVASVNQVISNITRWIVGILAGLATLFLTIGGLRYLMAGGDPARWSALRWPCGRRRPVRAGDPGPRHRRRPEVPGRRVSRPAPTAGPAAAGSPRPPPRPRGACAALILAAPRTPPAPAAAAFGCGLPDRCLPGSAPASRAFPDVPGPVAAPAPRRPRLRVLRCHLQGQQRDHRGGSPGWPATPCNPLLHLIGRDAAVHPAGGRDPRGHADVGRVPRYRRLRLRAAGVIGGALVMGHETLQTSYAFKDIAPRLVTGFLTANLSLVLIWPGHRHRQRPVRCAGRGRR